MQSARIFNQNLTCDVFSDKRADKFIMHWSPEVCISDRTLDQVYSKTMSASTHVSTLFIIIMAFVMLLSVRKNGIIVFDYQTYYLRISSDYYYYYT